VFLCLTFFVACSCPESEVKYMYKTEVIKVPVYQSPLDNVTKIEKPKLERFYFSENGTVCLDETNFKILVNDLLLMKDYADRVDKIIKTLGGN